jgi:hypothetical protein
MAPTADLHWVLEDRVGAAIDGKAVRQDKRVRMRADRGSGYASPTRFVIHEGKNGHWASCSWAA